MQLNIILALVILSLNLQFSFLDLKAQSDLKIGDKAPDINLPSTNRTTNYKLSDLRGKVVLVNFWASLMAPCRYENPNLVKSFNEFKNKNFIKGNGYTIFSVSLDSNVDNWKNAIEKDKLIWPYHVSDLKGYNSAIIKQYAIKGIPANFLLDSNGNIIAINLRGQQLINTLKSLLK